MDTFDCRGGVGGGLGYLGVDWGGVGWIGTDWDGLGWSVGSVKWMFADGVKFERWFTVVWDGFGILAVDLTFW